MQKAGQSSLDPAAIDIFLVIISNCDLCAWPRCFILAVRNGWWYLFGNFSVSLVLVNTHFIMQCGTIIIPSIYFPIIPIWTSKTLGLCGWADAIWHRMHGCFRMLSDARMSGTGWGGFSVSGHDRTSDAWLPLVGSDALPKPWDTAVGRMQFGTGCTDAFGCTDVGYWLGWVQRFMT